MSVYTDSMVTELCASAHTYQTATEFASKHNLSARSVISKIKSLGLAYERKPIAVSSGVVRVRKAELVRAIEDKLGLRPEALSGLGKADAAALSTILAGIK